MGPLSIERGMLDVDGLAGGGIDASMGPRSIERGKFGADITEGAKALVTSGNQRLLGSASDGKRYDSSSE